MFIQTESTPNPATMKFLPGREVMGEAAVADFPSREAAERSPLARALFAQPDVTRVFFGSDFISVTKSDAADWRHMKPAVLGAIRAPRASRDEMMSVAQNIAALCQRYLGEIGVSLQVRVHAMGTPHDRLFVFRTDELNRSIW